MNVLFQRFKGIILRPLFSFTATFFILYCVLFCAGHIAKAILFSASAVLFVLSVVFRIKQKDDVKKAVFRFFAFLFSAIILSSFLSVTVFDITVPAYKRFDGVSAPFSGKIEEVRYDVGYGGYYRIKTDKIGHEDIKADVYLFAADKFEENDLVNGRADFEYINKPESEYYDYRQSYVSDGIFLAAEAKSCSRVGEEKPTLVSYARKANGLLSGILVKQMGKDYGGFSSALLLGNKTNLPDIFQRNFRRLGISHILAISGMHLSVIISLFGFLFKPFGKNVRNVLLIVLVIAYMFLTGFQASVTRAGIMSIILILSTFFQRTGDAYTSLGVSVFLISIFNPFSACDIGLQLSFSAVLAVLMTTQKKREIKKKNKIAKRLKNLILPFRISIAVILFLLPLEWLYFERICYLSPLASVLFSLAATLLLWILPFQLAFSFITPLSKMLSTITVFICKLVGQSSTKLALIPNITLFLKFAGGIFFCIALLILIIFALTGTGKSKIIPTIGCIAVFVALVITSNVVANTSFNNTLISSVNYSKNDGIALYDSRKSAIIDIGNGYSKTVAKAESELGKYGSDEISFLILTHYHEQYASTLSRLFDKSIVRRVFVPEADEGYIACISSLCKEKNVELTVYSYGESIAVGNSSIVVEEPRYIKRSNQPIISINVSSFGKSYCYVGAAFNDTDLEPVGDVIWYGEHGPKYKNNFVAEPLSIIYPQAAEFCEGKDSEIFTVTFNRKGINK